MGALWELWFAYHSSRQVAMHTPSGLRSLAIGIAVGVTAIAVAVPAAALASPSPRAVGAMTIAAPRLPFGSRVERPIPSGTRIELGVYLEPRPGLAAYAAAVSDVHSKLFRHYLARGAFATRFGATAAEVDRVSTALERDGLVVQGLSANRLELKVTGSTGSMANAFDTRFAEIRLPDGVVGRATTTAVHVPATIAGSITSIVGFDTLERAQTSLEPVDQLRHPMVRGVGHDFASTRPRSVPGAPSACAQAVETTELGFGGITDDQVASAYGVDGLYAEGDFAAGQTVAIYELEPFNMPNIATFDQCYFGESHTSQIKVIPVDGGAGEGVGSGEAALDIENVSALAPDASIEVYEGSDTPFAALDTYNQIVSDDTAQTVTSSWGYCETDQLDLSPGALAAENLIFEQAAAQGQTVFNSAGDAGDDSCSYDSGFPTNPVLSVDDPASQPYVVGVGGTTAVNVDQPPAQQVWNDGANGGAGGGGISTIWAQPAWMPSAADSLSSAKPCSAPTGETCRTVPDVTAFADEYTGITIYWDGQWGTIGGTSSSSPIWAAMLAEINASPTCLASPSTAHGVGFAAPLLYDVASNATDYASGFTNVTTGNNDMFNLEGGDYPARTGYSLAAGLGSPELTAPVGAPGPGLADTLCAAAAGGTTAKVTSIDPSEGTTAGGTTVTITGSGFYLGGVPDVSQVDFGTAAASFTVDSNTEITATSPAASAPTTNSTMAALTHGAGGALVTVTTTDHDVALGPSFHFESTTGSGTAPTVIQVGPTGGAGAGGTSVRIYGTGFDDATSVTFGGVAASFHVESDVLIIAKSPREQATQCDVKDRATLGVCQTQIQVTGPGGTSRAVHSVRPYTGNLYVNEFGLYQLPRKCGCEAYPTITEFDYVTKVHLTKILGDDGFAIVGNPSGGDFVELEGTGMNILTLNWVNFGYPQYDSAYDWPFTLNSTGTVMQLESNPDQLPGPTQNTVAVALDTVGGESNSVRFTYQATPTVTSLSTGVITTAGGEALSIHGEALTGTQEIYFVPSEYGLSFLEDGGLALSQSGNDLYNPPVAVLANFTVHSATLITLPTPSMVPGAYDVYVCNEDTCGSGTSDLLSNSIVAVAPGTTAVTSAIPEGSTKPPDTAPEGPVAGGTAIEIQGTNFGPLGDITVSFVNEEGEAVTTTAVTAGPAATDPGATESIIVDTPPALGGFADTDAIVVTGDNGASPVNGTAYFVYTS